MQVIHSYDQQLERQLLAEARAKDSFESNQRKLKAIGKESALTYGQRLYKTLVGDVAKSLDKTFTEYLLDPDKARINGAAIPFFNPFKSVDHIASIALVATIDQLSRKHRLATFCQGLGAAIEKECRLLRLENKSPLELRHLMRQGISRKKISSRKIMKQLGCIVPEFNDLSRLHIGKFLLDHVLTTGLIRVAKHRVGRTTPRFVLPTAEVELFIRECKSSHYKVAHSAMVCPPEKWPGLYGGGILGNEECLIRVPLQDCEEKDTTAIEHYRKADLNKYIAVVNHLQDPALKVRKDTVKEQRITWDNGFDGLWPCSKIPKDVPDRLGDNPSKEDLRERNRMASMAHRDREQNRPRRIKIERYMQQAEELCAQPVWQAYHSCHRGRIYTSNKYCTTQGPDYEKGVMEFYDPLPVDDASFEWLLTAAAGHYGLSRSTWEERLNWGEEHIEMMKITANDPLGKVELWRNAKDPWQFLQACKGVKEVLDTGQTGVPVRFDQTTSGCGILSALLRNKRIGRLCNLYGDSPADLYTLVAEKVIERLTHDLQFGENKEKALAAVWLKRGISRSLCKKPILSAPYGGSYLALCDTLVDALDEHLGYVPLENFAYEVAVPAKYLASHLWDEMKEHIQPCLELKKWLMKVTKKVMSKGHPVEWTMPNGWPMKIADREPVKSRIKTLLYGEKIHISMKDQPITSKLSSTQANKGIAANFTHAWDACFLSNLCYKAVEQGIPLVTNHDCFACHTAHAGTLHSMLHETFAELYAPNWLIGIKDEIQLSTGIMLPNLPAMGELNPGIIGSNPYLFS